MNSTGKHGTACDLTQKIPGSSEPHRNSGIPSVSRHGGIPRRQIARIGEEISPPPRSSHRWQRKGKGQCRRSWRAHESAAGSRRGGQHEMGKKIMLLLRNKNVLYSLDDQNEQLSEGRPTVRRPSSFLPPVVDANIS